MHNKLLFLPDVGKLFDNYDEENIILRLMYKEIQALHEIITRNSTIECDKSIKIFPVRRLCTIMTVDLNTPKLYDLFDKDVEQEIIDILEPIANDSCFKQDDYCCFEQLRKDLGELEFADYNIGLENKFTGGMLYNTFY